MAGRLDPGLQLEIVNYVYDDQCTLYLSGFAASAASIA